VVAQGAIYAQPCCPSPLHGFPSALGIEIPEGKQGDLGYVIDEITKIMAAKGMTGRTSTWPVPVAMMFINGLSEYAKSWILGEFTEKMNIPILTQKLADYAGVDITLNPLVEGGVTYDNFQTVLLDYIIF
jgi:hypothetical protein